MASSYLKQSRHGSTFYFRRRVPDDLRPTLGKFYLVKTLGTGKRRDAIILARSLAAKTDCLFAHLRIMPNHEQENINVDLIFKLDLNDLGGLKSVYIEANTPEEQAQGEAMLDRTLLALKAPQPSLLPGKSFSDAVGIYLGIQRKGTTRNTYRGRLEHAQAFFGMDKDIRHIEQADFAEYAEHANSSIANSNTAGFHITTLGGMLNHFRITKGWGAKLTSERLPELIIKELTCDEVDAMRKAGREDEAIA